jgi:hypothetical protein
MSASISSMSFRFSLATAPRTTGTRLSEAKSTKSRPRRRTARRASRSMEATRNPNAAARAEPSAMREGDVPSRLASRRFASASTSRSASRRERDSASVAAADAVDTAAGATTARVVSRRDGRGKRRSERVRANVAHASV